MNMESTTRTNFNSKIRWFGRKNLFYAISFLALLTILAQRLKDFTGVRYLTADDIGWSIIPKAQAFHLGMKSAIYQGRIFHILVMPVYDYVISLNSQPCYDALNLGAFVTAFALVLKVIRDFTDITLACLFAVFFWAFLPQLWNHVPPGSYPVYPFLPITAFCISILFLQRYAKQQNGLLLVATLLFYFFSLFASESLLLIFPPLITYLAWILYSRHHLASGMLSRVWGGIFGVSLLYASIYLTWRLYYPTSYSGVQLGPISLYAIAHTVWQYAIGSIIFYYMFHNHYYIQYFDTISDKTYTMFGAYHFRDILASLTLPSLGVAILSGVLAGWIAYKASKCLPARALVATLLVGLLLSALSPMLYGLTGKYTDWVLQGSVAYFGSRYAYFGLTLVLASMAVLTLNFSRWRFLTIVLISFIGFATAAGSATTSFFNGRVAATMRLQKGKWDMMNTVLNYPPFADHLLNRTILAPRLWDYVWGARILEDDYWTRFSQLYHGERIFFLREAQASQEHDFNAYFDYRLGRTGEFLGALFVDDLTGKRTDSVLLMTENSHETTVSFNDADGNHTQVIESSPGQKDSNDRYKVSRLSGDQIEISSIMLTEPSVIPLPDADGKIPLDSQWADSVLRHKTFALDFGYDDNRALPQLEGFCDPEDWGRWSCQQDVKIHFELQNLRVKPLYIKLVFRAFVAKNHNNQTFEFYLNGHLLKKGVYSNFSHNAEVFDITNLIKRDNTLLVRVPDAVTPQSINFNNDPRLLGIGMIKMEFRNGPFQNG